MNSELSYKMVSTRVKWKVDKLTICAEAYIDFTLGPRDIALKQHLTTVPSLPTAVEATDRSTFSSLIST